MQNTRGVSQRSPAQGPLPEASVSSWGSVHQGPLPSIAAHSTIHQIHIAPAAGGVTEENSRMCVIQTVPGQSPWVKAQPRSACQRGPHPRLGYRMGPRYSYSM